MADFAPGLPVKHQRGEPTKVLQPGELYDYVLQHHSTVRNPKRPHYDLRIGGPEGMYSWAIPGAVMPEPGERKLAPQTEVHRHGYKDFQGRIGQGYGAGDVRQADLGKALITKVTPDTVSFTLAHTKVPVRYSLVKIKTESGRDWLLINKPIPGKVPGVGDKPKYQMIQAADLDEAVEQAKTVQEKIDGAHGVIDIGNQGKVETYSVNPRVTGEPIPHTERMGTHGLEIPALKGTTLRGVLYGVSKETGKAIPFNRLSGILNASIAKSLEKQKADKVKMRTGVFDVIQHKGKPVEFKSEEERQALLDTIVSQLPAEQFHKPQTAVTTQEKADLVTDIRTGRNPRTQEGVVMRMPDGNIKKFKLRPESTAYMTGIFPGEGKRKAIGGGFTYGTEPGGPTVGNVGTGFTDQELAEVAKNVKEYMGKPMRIESMGQFESGKHRAPSFAGWEVDKTAELTLITGFLGSGKSTRAKAIVRRDGAEYVSVDVLRSQNRDKRLPEFMQMLNDAARKAIHSPEHVVMEGIHVARMDPHVIAHAQHVIKTNTPEGVSTLRAIVRNLRRAKDPGKRVYGWPALRVVKDIMQNQRRFHDAVVAFPETPGFLNKKSQWIGVDLASVIGYIKRHDNSELSTMREHGTDTRVLAKASQAPLLLQDLSRQSSDDLSAKDLRDLRRSVQDQGLHGSLCHLSAPGMPKSAQNGSKQSKLARRYNAAAQTGSDYKGEPGVAQDRISTGQLHLSDVREKRGQHASRSHQGVGLFPRTALYGEQRTHTVSTVSPKDIQTGLSATYRNTEKQADSKRSSGYTGVDLDGTLAKYTTWKGHKHIGEPVPKMLERVKRMLATGEKVKIFTARASDGEKAINPIKAWCKKHLGKALPVTNIKDHNMKKIIDDKAEGVVKNTGEKKAQVSDLVQRLIAATPILAASSLAHVKQRQAEKQYESNWQDAPRPFLFKPSSPPGTHTISSQRDIDKLVKNLVPAGRPDDAKTMRRQLQHVLARSGINAFSGTLRGPMGSIEPTVVIGKDAPTSVYRHEYGHIQDIIDKIKAGKSVSNHPILNALMTPIIGVKRTPAYKEEVAAWNRSGIKEDDPLRQSALQTYEAGGKGWEWPVRYGVPGYAAIRMMQGGKEQGVMDMALKKLTQMVKGFKGNPTMLLKRGQTTNAVPPVKIPMYMKPFIGRNERARYNDVTQQSGSLTNTLSKAYRDLSLPVRKMVGGYYDTTTNMLSRLPEAEKKMYDAVTMRNLEQTKGKKYIWPGDLENLMGNYGPLASPDVISAIGKKDPEAALKAYNTAKGKVTVDAGKVQVTPPAAPAPTRARAGDIAQLTPGAGGR